MKGDKTDEKKGVRTYMGESRYTQTNTLKAWTETAAGKVRCECATASRLLYAVCDGREDCEIRLGFCSQCECDRIHPAVYTRV